MAKKDESINSAEIAHVVRVLLGPEEEWDSADGEFVMKLYGIEPASSTKETQRALRPSSMRPLHKAPARVSSLPERASLCLWVSLAALSSAGYPLGQFFADCGFQCRGIKVEFSEPAIERDSAAGSDQVRAAGPAFIGGFHFSVQAIHCRGEPDFQFAYADASVVLLLRDVAGRLHGYALALIHRALPLAR